MVQPTFLRKTLAFLFDILVLNIFILPGFTGILSKMVPSDGFTETLKLYSAISTNQAIVATVTTLTILMSVYVLLYFSLTEYLLGSTLGMLILGMGVVDRNKNKPNIFACFIRNLYSLPFFPFILLWVVDPLYLIFKKNGQRFSEMMTNTKVIFSG